MNIGRKNSAFVITGRMVFALIFTIIHLFMASQLYLLAKDIVYGDGSSQRLVIAPRYPAMRVPWTPFTSRYEAPGRLCADFAQVYFPSENIAALREAYSPRTTLDPWGRESKYPPLLHLLFASTFCRLSYGPAGLLHLSLQTVLFLASFIFVFYRLKLTKFLLPSLLLVDVCLFLTPVGLSWLERGQFTLYVGLSYLWLLLALITGEKKYALLSSIFAFIKWTSFPFIFVALSVFMAHAQSRRQFKERLLLSLIFPVTFAALFCMLPRNGLSFLYVIMNQELTYIPLGLSLARIVPRSIVKALPFFLIAAGAACRTKRPETTNLLPFYAGAATILLTYPTFAFDYSVPCLLAFIPFIISWAGLPHVTRFGGIGFQVSFYLFLILASFSIVIFPSEPFVIVLYIIVSILLMLPSCFPGAGVRTEASS